MEVYYDFFCTSCVSETVISYPAFSSSSGDASTHCCIAAYRDQCFNVVERYCSIASSGSSPYAAISLFNHNRLSCQLCVNGVCCSGRNLDNVVYGQYSNYFDRSAIVIGHSFTRHHSADTANQQLISDDFRSGHDTWVNADW